MDVFEQRQRRSIRLRQAIRDRIQAEVRAHHRSACEHADADIEWSDRGRFGFHCFHCGLTLVGRTDERNPDIDA